MGARRRQRGGLLLGFAIAAITGVIAPAAWAQGACCTPSSCLPAASESQCAGLGGVFLAGESCAASPCGVGACCFAKSCNTADAYSCITAGREFAGAGTTCLEDPCNSNVGACCLGNGACNDISPLDCNQGGGVWLGAGTNCALGLCEEGACCSPGVCEEQALHECNASQGAFQLGEDCVSPACQVSNGCALNSLVGQSPDEPGAFTAYVSETSSGLLRSENYDGAAGPIESVTWWGLEMAFGPTFTPCEEADPTFQISFREDVAGQPGDVVCSYTLTATVTPSGILYQGAELNQYSVALPAPCIHPVGWVSIVGLGETDCWLLWMSSRDGDVFSHCEGCASEVEDDDLAFCLGGNHGGAFGACCNQSTGLCTDGVEIPDCIGPGLRFEHDTACAALDPPCSQVPGGCCFENGACNDQLASDCVAAGGSWLGAGASCDLCPPVGACCLDERNCTYQTSEVCDQLGQTWLGEGTSCDECPPAPTCPPDSLFAQSPDPPSEFLAGTSEENADLRRWEDFTGLSGPVASVSFWGVDLEPLGGQNWAECVETDPTFRISFHEDAGGAPGAEVCSYVVTASYTPTGQMYLGTELNAYGVTLPTPCVLVNGWVSIVGLGDPDCWFLWMGAGTGYSWCDNCLPSQQDMDLNVCLGGSPGGSFGACCEDATATCTDAVEITSCLGAEQRFAPNELCSALDPPCGTIVGACCRPNGTCSVSTDEACGPSANWLGPNTLCDQCPCVTPCPAGGLPEGEPVCTDNYVDEFNGGCFESNPVYSRIELNTSTCGESGVFFEGPNAAGDYDWYEVEVTTTTTLSFEVEAEFRPRAWIIDGSPGCKDLVVLAQSEALECQELTLSANVDPGTYWFLVGPAGFTDTAGCPAAYTAKLTNLPLPLTLRLDDTGLQWTGFGPRYDVVRGDLATLRGSGGDFTLATLDCLANNQGDPFEVYPAVPTSPGEGYWFLVRRVAGTIIGSYDSGGPGQLGARDVEIDAAAGSCP